MTTYSRACACADPDCIKHGCKLYRPVFPSYYTPVVAPLPATIGAEVFNTLREIVDLKRRVKELEEALEEAIDSEGGVAYDGDEDEVGYRVCCKESSYKPHDASCWVTKARAALTPQQGEK